MSDILIIIGFALFGVVLWIIERRERGRRRTPSRCSRCATPIADDAGLYCETCRQAVYVALMTDARRCLICTQPIDDGGYSYCAGCRAQLALAAQASADQPGPLDPEPEQQVRRLLDQAGV